jgi:hypothetical protein
MKSWTCCSKRFFFLVGQGVVEAHPAFEDGPPLGRESFAENFIASPGFTGKEPVEQQSRDEDHSGKVKQTVLHG